MAARNLFKWCFFTLYKHLIMYQLFTSVIEENRSRHQIYTYAQVLQQSDKVSLVTDSSPLLLSMKDSDKIKVKLTDDQKVKKKIKQTRRNQVIEIEFDKLENAKQLASKFDVFHLKLEKSDSGQSSAMLFQMDKKQLKKDNIILLEEESSSTESETHVSWKHYELSDTKPTTYHEIENGLKLHPYSLYQWSTLARDNQLQSPDTREVFVIGSELNADDDYKVYFALVHNSAPLEETSEKGSDPDKIEKKFDAVSYDLTIDFEFLLDNATCLNECSKHGTCNQNAELSIFPYCECFQDFAGADCGLVSKSFTLDEEIQLKLLQGSSTLFTATVTNPNLSLTVGNLKGSLTIYSNIVDLTDKYKIRDQNGLKGNWNSLSSIPSPVNYDSKHEFKDIRGDNTASLDQPLTLKYNFQLDEQKIDKTFQISILVICKKSADIESQQVPSEAKMRVSQIDDLDVGVKGNSAAIIMTTVIIILLLLVACAFFAYKKCRRRQCGQRTEQKAPDLIAALPQGFTEPNASNADLLNNDDESRINDDRSVEQPAIEVAERVDFQPENLGEASASFTGDDEVGASSSDEAVREMLQPRNQAQAQEFEFARYERAKLRKEKRKAMLEKWFKEMKYIDIKKVLIRLKSRKFLTQQCLICLQPIENESQCRMLNCYHIFHSECIEQWFIEHMKCPMCNKSFKRGADKRYNLDEFLQTINVDNECFYSDHLIQDNKLASTNTILQNDPFFLMKKRQRVQSFDLAAFMRKSDYMDQLRADESRQGPLKIVKLPTRTAPFALSGMTPKTLADMGLFRKTSKKMSGMERSAERLVLQSLEFHDVNEEYEEAKRVNLVTELKVIQSSKHMSFNSIESEDSSMPQSASNHRYQDDDGQNGAKNRINFENMQMPESKQSKQLYLDQFQEANNSKQDEKDLRETPLKVLWKKNGRVYHAKKVRASFEPYPNEEAKNKPKTDRSIVKAARILQAHQQSQEDDPYPYTIEDQQKQNNDDSRSDSEEQKDTQVACTDQDTSIEVIEGNNEVLEFDHHNQEKLIFASPGKPGLKFGSIDDQNSKRDNKDYSKYNHNSMLQPQQLSSESVEQKSQSSQCSNQQQEQSQRLLFNQQHQMRCGVVDSERYHLGQIQQYAVRPPNRQFHSQMRSNIVMISQTDVQQSPTTSSINVNNHHDIQHHNHNQQLYSRNPTHQEHHSCQDHLIKQRFKNSQSQIAERESSLFFKSPLGSQDSKANHIIKLNQKQQNIGRQPNDPNDEEEQKQMPSEERKEQHPRANIQDDRASSFGSVPESQHEVIHISNSLMQQLNEGRQQEEGTDNDDDSQEEQQDEQEDYPEEDLELSSMVNQAQKQENNGTADKKNEEKPNGSNNQKVIVFHCSKNTLNRLEKMSVQQQHAVEEVKTTIGTGTAAGAILEESGEILQTGSRVITAGLGIDVILQDQQLTDLTAAKNATSMNRYPNNQNISNAANDYSIQANSDEDSKLQIVSIQDTDRNDLQHTNTGHNTAANQLQQPLDSRHILVFNDEEIEQQNRLSAQSAAPNEENKSSAQNLHITLNEYYHKHQNSEVQNIQNGNNQAQSMNTAIGQSAQSRHRTPFVRPNSQLLQNSGLQLTSSKDKKVFPQQPPRNPSTNASKNHNEDGIYEHQYDISSSNQIKFVTATEHTDGLTNMVVKDEGTTMQPPTKQRIQGNMGVVQEPSRMTTIDKGINHQNENNERENSDEDLQ